MKEKDKLKRKRIKNKEKIKLNFYEKTKNIKLNVKYHNRCDCLGCYNYDG